MSNCIAALLGTAALASAQAEPPQANATLLTPQSVVTDGPHVPIYQQPTDPVRGDLGIWAGGNRYKVSFHDGMEIHPYLGRHAPHGLPVRWQTRSLSIAEHTTTLGEAVSRVRVDDFRFEYHFESGLIERYDVLPEGVEQSFVIPRPEGRLGAGDLTVTGAMSSPLTPSIQPVGDSGQAAIHFVDAKGQEILRYGEAIAFDAAGKRTVVSTTSDGDIVRLTVPAAFVETATWPICIDPLLLPSTLATSFDILETDLTSAGQSDFTDAMLVISVAAAAGDQDVFAYQVDADLNNPVLSFSETFVAVNSVSPSVAFVRSAGANGRFAVAWERDGGFVSTLAAYVHDLGNPTAQSGSILFIPFTQNGNTDRNPEIGGSDGNSALIVYQTDTTSSQANTNNTNVHYVRLDVAAATIVDRDDLGAPVSTVADRENPSVSQTTSSASPQWIVCYQERTSSLISIPWRIIGQRISALGSNGTPTVIDISTTSQRPFLTNPHVDSFEGRAGVVASQSDLLFSPISLRFTRFDWGDTSSTPTVLSTSTLAVSQSNQPFLDGSIAHDSNTRSHWAISYARSTSAVELWRVGFNGIVVDQDTAASGAGLGSAAVAYDRRFHTFISSYVDDALLTSAAIARFWTYPGTSNMRYGSSCLGTIETNGFSLLGTEDWTVRLTGAQPNLPAALFVAFSPSATDLSGIGMWFCSLLADPIVAIPVTSDSNGEAEFAFDLTTSLDLHLQWFLAAPGLNPAGIGATEGIVSTIR